MAKSTSKQIGWGLIGYGGAFNMGKAHGGAIESQKGMKVTAVCDMDETRFIAAEADFPGVKTFTSVDEMLKCPDVDAVVIITPHNTHADIAIKAAKAGKHVVVEKPMCITVKEATNMIKAAEKSKVMLSIFHNRRQDGDYKAIQKIVKEGLIGDIFHMELFMGGYGRPGSWWRSDKEISGGCLYDWGAHLVDWVLNLVPSRMEAVTGFFHKLYWHEVTNEDHTQAIIKFRNGAVADVQVSSLARIGKPRWRVLGTKGALMLEGDKIFVSSEVDGLPTEMRVSFDHGDWAHYYVNVADHLLRGKKLEVTGEQARRVIAVLEGAEKSSKSGMPEKVPFE